MRNLGEKLFKYALNQEGKLVHIDSVPNGKNCGCVCPYCGGELIAKKKGEKREPHFAHKGDRCAKYHETTLHQLAKLIIKEGKTVMLPAYKNLKPERIRFKEVEIEERNDLSSLQPDCVGITEEGIRIHIEIFVTHKVDEWKREKIEKNDINSMEIEIPVDFPQNREKLKDFIENSCEGRVWVNYPYSDVLIKKEAQITAQNMARWYMENAKEWLRTPLECGRCVRNKPMENCQYHLYDIVYDDKRYVVCTYKFYKHDNHLGEDGLIPTKDSSGKLTKTIDEAEQRRWDIADGKYPAFFKDCY